MSLIISPRGPFIPQQYRRQSVFYDDFVGAAYDSYRWNVAGTGSTTLMSTAGGQIRVRGNSSNQYILFGLGLPFPMTKHNYVEIRASMSPSTGTGRSMVGVSSDSSVYGTDYALLEYYRDGVVTHFTAVTSNAAEGWVREQTDVLLDNSMHVFSVEWDSSFIQYAIDGVPKIMKTTHIPIHPMGPWIQSIGGASTTDTVVYYVLGIGDP